MFIDDQDMTVYTVNTVPVEQMSPEQDSPVLSISTRYSNENRFKFIRTLSTKTSCENQSQPSAAEELSPILIRGRPGKSINSKGSKKQIAGKLLFKVTLSSLKQPGQSIDDESDNAPDSLYKPIRYKSECDLDHQGSDSYIAETDKYQDSKIGELNITGISPEPQFLSMRCRDKSSRNMLLDPQQIHDESSVNEDKHYEEQIDTVIDHLAVLKNDDAFMDYVQNKRLEEEKVVREHMTPIRRRLSSAYLVSMPHKVQAYTFNR